MKRMTLCMLATFCLSGICAQEMKTDSLWADSLVRTLPEVMVTGERPVVKAKAGRLEYDLPRIIEGKPADNIYDALKYLPGVAEMNGALTLGARGVTIVLDGKVTNMSTEQLYALLKSMPADRIERVDVMYNAPARYQVRGAMIDVRLKHRIGDPGAVQGEAYAQYNQSHEASFQERASLLYNGGKFSLDFLYSHAHGKGFNTTDKEARHWQEAEDKTYLIENHEVARNRNHTHSFRLGTDYQFGKDHHLSFVYNGSYLTRHVRQHTVGTQTATNRRNQTSWLHNGRLDYRTPIGLSAGAEFTWYQVPGDQRMQSEMEGTRLDFYTEDRQRINAWKFYLAQEHSLKHGWGLNYGAVYTTSVDNSYQLYFNNEELRMKNDEVAGELPPDMKSRRREQTLNVYAGFNKNFGKTLMLDASLAVERYQTPVWDEWDVYPVLNLTYLPAPGHILQLDFSSDKGYPTYWEVQNAVSYMSGGYSEIQGNPLLKPSKDYQVSLSYILKSKYVFSFWFDHNKDMSLQLLYQSPEKLLEIYKSLNLDFRQQAGVQASIPFKAGTWLDTRLTLMGMWLRDKDSDFYDLPFDRHTLAGIAVLNATFKLPVKPDLRFTLNGFCQTGAIQGIYDLPTSGNLDLSLRYAFARGNCILTAWCKDIFQTAGIDPQIRYGRQWVTNDYSCFRSVGVSFAWRFGGYQEKKREGVDTSRFK
ncbi:MAG TPA: outer membrane beta-barrel protein [Candidatus Bacteroides merdigallinarum]|uniref:Outer membrane beta-barrel protein n=1 Tax=Candidatus Bacteroides merdigallinarum TaxID=2838473 RepID=A0A9D2E8Y3_9BACE|nr:outer membrane beta-barrel protein [Candidatus Bacteroides merdigallinarum]